MSEELTYWGWHFLRADMTSKKGNEPPWEVGETRTVADRPILCKYGYHSSPTPRDALTQQSGVVLCRVVSSVPIESDYEESCNRKSVSKSRKLVAFANVTDTMRLFAVNCAESVLPLFEERQPNDGRVRECFTTARQYLKTPNRLTLYRSKNARLDARNIIYERNSPAVGVAVYAAFATIYAASCAYGDDVEIDAAFAAGYAAEGAFPSDATEREWQTEHFTKLLKTAHSSLFVDGVF